MKNTNVVIVCPALADANNGNWQTARRWQKMLAPSLRVDIVREWAGGPGATTAQVMLALHARRSASSIVAWAHAHGATRDAAGLAVVLTGTDLYRDIHVDALAAQSLVLARVLVTLQECGPEALPATLRAKACVIFQSTTERTTLAKTTRHLRVVMVGHLREEKAPQTLFRVARLLPADSGIFIDHVGAPLDPALGRLARATAERCPAYRWLGALPHEATRRLIQRAHVLVHCSRIEGGAHVLMEALRCGTPVLASRIPGNVGMLGSTYEGYFEVDDARGLAALLLRWRGEQNLAQQPLAQALARHCERRAALFAPQAERAALHRLVAQLRVCQPPEARATQTRWPSART